MLYKSYHSFCLSFTICITLGVSEGTPRTHTMTKPSLIAAMAVAQSIDRQVTSMGASGMPNGRQMHQFLDSMP